MPTKTSAALRAYVEITSLPFHHSHFTFWNILIDFPSSAVWAAEGLLVCITGYSVTLSGLYSHSSTGEREYWKIPPSGGIDIFIGVLQRSSRFPAQSQPRCLIQNFYGLVPMWKVTRRSKHSLENKVRKPKHDVLGQASRMPRHLPLMYLEEGTPRKGYVHTQPMADQLQYCFRRAHERIQNDILFPKLRCYYNLNPSSASCIFPFPACFQVSASCEQENIQATGGKPAFCHTQLPGSVINPEASTLQQSPWCRKFYT